jgi:hypothetical protein
MKTFMALIAIFLFFNFFINSSFAQNEVESEGPKNTFNFYFINGYAISYNFYEAQSYYLRAGLDISTTKENIDSDGEIIQYPSGYKSSTTESSDNSYFSIGASVQIILPVYKTKYGNIYFGTGPVFTYSTTNNNSSRTYNDQVPTNTSNYTNSTYVQNYDVAAIVLVGVEGIITDNISLFVEANIKGGGRWQHTESEYSNTDPTGYQYKNTSSSDGNGWFYEAQFIRMGVSISL